VGRAAGGEVIHNLSSMFIQSAGRV
jgi:hypothetical protein